jgi:hypothetical protein
MTRMAASSSRAARMRTRGAGSLYAAPMMSIAALWPFLAPSRGCGLHLVGCVGLLP